MSEILILMGSDSDLPVVSDGLSVLKDFGVDFEVHISSAHRCLERTLEIVTDFENGEGKVIIAAAGMSAHLAGVVSAHTTLPVIGIPLSSGDFAGLDSLLSMIEMPPGIPVGVMGKGKAGAKNAALLAIQILALSNPALKQKVRDFRVKLKDEVAEKDKKLQSEGWENYSK
jgi:5-(carboxyamino)imidazole ribonucleotide mutase